MENNILLSVVSPVYNAETILEELIRRLTSVLQQLSGNSYEIILVEDRGKDQSWKKIEEICASDNHVKGIRLSRNFGQHYAITAGIAEAKGEFTVVIDCDLQDRPDYIRLLLEEANKGIDIVYTKRHKRKHSLFKDLFSAAYYSLYKFLSGSSVVENNIGSYSLISRRVREEFLKIKDFHRHYILILSMLGFNHSVITIEHDERFSGRSSYSFSKLLSHAINGITSQSVRLLRLSIGVGVVFVFVAFIYAAYIIWTYFSKGLMPGYASLMVTMLFGTGLILTSIGIAGIYIGKIFEQVKDRPLYIISDKVNF